MQTLIALLLITLVGYSSAQVFGFGKCPDVRPVRRLDFNLYAGRWYEIARFYNYVEEGLRCQSSNYTLQDGYLLANESVVDAYGRSNSTVVNIYRATEEDTGRLYYSSATPGEYSVSFVDYDKYSMSHVCNEYLFGFINVQYNWIVARDRMMPEEDYNEALRVLAAMGINVRKFKKADQRDCPVYDRVPRGTDEPELMRTEWVELVDETDKE